MSSRLCSRNALTVCRLASLFHRSTFFIFCCASPLLLVSTYYPLPSPVTVTRLSDCYHALSLISISAFDLHLSISTRAAHWRRTTCCRYSMFPLDTMLCSL